MDFLDSEHFEDPALRSALKRSLGNQRAPEELRNRVQMMLSASRVTPARQMSRPRSILLGFSAAAVILLSVGLVAVQIRNYLWSPSQRKTAAVPETLASALLKTHDNCSRLSDHHLIPGKDLAEISKKLTTDLGYNVIVPDMQGWVFKGAGECMVADRKAAHIMYSSGDETLSVFTLPTDVVAHGAPPTMDYYEVLSNQHAVTAFVDDQSLYCLVAASTGHTMTLAELRPLTSRVRNTMRGHECGVHEGFAMYPVR